MGSRERNIYVGGEAAYEGEVGREDDVGGVFGGYGGEDEPAEGVLCKSGVVLVELGETRREDRQVGSVES